MPSYTSKTPEQGRHSRFVTLCQQMLALAVVVAVLTPAARTVSMDVLPPESRGALPAELSLRSAEFPSQVPTEAVEAEVEEFSLTAPARTARARANLRSKAARPAPGGGESITSEVLPVDGYGTVGVTWSPDEEVHHDGIEVQVRSRINGTWSGWTAAEYHDEHGPDPTTPEGRNARPGTDALLVGDVEAVQVRVDTEDDAPADLKVAVIDPGKATATTTERPAIDTGRLAKREGTAPASAPAATSTGGEAPVEELEEEVPEGDPTVEGDDLTLQAGTFTPRPKIYSRAQWGANERWRDKRSLSYYEVHGGYVHHTVNANNYSQAEVPGIIRGIYSYHTRSRGWSDIGYNFLVDKFGRIWEGRAGGVERPVVGAHTSGYNQHSFAMSAIGNFETARPTSAMLNAYGALFAWKLSLHGIAAADTSQKIGNRYFPAISGHRDAGSTACPGRYLYAQIPTIRQLASQGQRSFRGRELEGQYVGRPAHDILSRRRSDGKLVIHAVQNVGGWKIVDRVVTNVNLPDTRGIHKAGDWNRDGRTDVIAQRRSGLLLLYLGRKREGRFKAPIALSRGFKNISLVAAVGDVTGDGWPDLMGQPIGGGMRIYPGRGMAGLAASYPAYRNVTGRAHVPAGLMNDDGAPDSLVRDGRHVRLYAGNGPGGWSSERTLEVTLAGYNRFIGMGTLGRNNQPDFVVRQRRTGNAYFLRGTPNGWDKKLYIGNLKGYNLFA